MEKENKFELGFDENQTGQKNFEKFIQKKHYDVHKKTELGYVGMDDRVYM